MNKGREKTQRMRQAQQCLMTSGVNFSFQTKYNCFCDTTDTDSSIKSLKQITWRIFLNNKLWNQKGFLKIWTIMLQSSITFCLHYNLKHLLLY